MIGDYADIKNELCRVLKTATENVHRMLQFVKQD